MKGKQIQVENFSGGDSTNNNTDSVETELSCIQSGDIDKINELMNTKYTNDLRGFWSKYSFDIGHADIYGLVNSSLTSILTRYDFIKLIEGAATTGHLSILKFVYAKVPKIFRDSNVLEITKSNNHEFVLEWLYIKGFDCGEGVQSTKKRKVVQSTKKRKFVYESSSAEKKYTSFRELFLATTLKDDGTPSFLDIARGHKKLDCNIQRDHVI